MDLWALDDNCEPGDTHIFVLESPHLHEMMYSRMLAGDSGAEFSRFLSRKNTDTPFGLFGIPPWPSKPMSLRGIGAINACSFPMQADTYGPARKSLPGLNRAVQALGRIRDNPSALRRKYDWDKAFEDLVVQELERRIVPLLVSARVKFHPCGNVAAGLLTKAKSISSSEIRISATIPHPSVDGWKNLITGSIFRNPHCRQYKPFLRGRHRNVIRA